MTLQGPVDAQYFRENLFYKIGRFGFVFRWNGEEWVKSGLTEKDFNMKHELEAA